MPHLHVALSRPPALPACFEDPAAGQCVTQLQSQAGALRSKARPDHAALEEEHAFPRTKAGPEIKCVGLGRQAGSPSDSAGTRCRLSPP